MLTWISDHAGTLYFLFGIIAVLMAFLAARSRRGRDMALTAGAVGLIVLVFLVGRFVLTDRQQVSANIEAMKQATIDNKPAEIFKHVTKGEFRINSHAAPRDEMARKITALMQHYDIDDIHLWDMKVTVNGDTAEAIFNFKATAATGGVAAATATLQFVREDGQWKMREMKTFNLGTTAPWPIPGLN